MHQGAEETTATRTVIATSTVKMWYYPKVKKRTRKKKQSVFENQEKSL